jgi:hypothetical protein
VRVSDDERTIPPGGRPSRKNVYRRQFLRPPPPDMTVMRRIDPRLAGVALVMLVVILMLTFTNRTDTAPAVFANPPLVATGTVAADPGAVASIAARRAEIEALFGKDIWDVHDGTDFDESPQWRKVALTMAEMDPATITQRLEFSLNDRYADVMKSPELYRGRFVRMRGIVAPNYRAYKLKEPLGGRGDVYRGWVSDPDPDEPPVVFDMLDRPPEFKTVAKVADVVDVEGVFFRTVRYEASAGNGRTHMVEVPWIIGRTVKVYDQPKRTIPLLTGLLTTVGFLALLFGIVYLSSRGRRPHAGGNRPTGRGESSRPSDGRR